MTQCRFYKGEHNYPQDECDKSYCWAVLGNHPTPRVEPLGKDDPRFCEHEWEDILARVVMAQAKPLLDTRYAMKEGKLVTVERRFLVCVHCGQIRYTHPELGDLVCDPEASDGE
jgi:hypothetical protein